MFKQWLAEKLRLGRNIGLRLQYIDMTLLNAERTLGAVCTILAFISYVLWCPQRTIYS